MKQVLAQPISQAAVDLSPELIQKWRERIRQSTFAGYHYHMGTALQREGSLSAAIDAYRRAVLADPSQCEATHRLVTALRELGHEAEARQVDENMRRVNPHYTAQALIVIACEERERENYDAAINCLRSAAAEGGYDKCKMDAEFDKLGEQLWVRQKHIEAINYLREGIEAISDAPASLFRLAHILLANQDWNSASKLFKQCLILDPAHAQAHFHTGWLDMAAIRLEQAASAYERALRIGHTHSSSLALRLAWVRQAQLRFDDALTIYDHYNDGTPFAGIMQAYRALTLLAAGQLDVALSLIQEVRAKHDGSADLCTIHALTLAHNGCSEQAIAMHLQALEMDPRASVMPLAWHFMAYASTLTNQGRHEDAEVERQRAVSQGTDIIHFIPYLLPSRETLTGMRCA